MGSHEFPLTWAQHWCWVAQHDPQMAESLAQLISVPVPGADVSVCDVEKAVRWLVKRHEALRTKFRTDSDGCPVQTIEEDFYPAVRTVDSPTALSWQEAEQVIGEVDLTFNLGEEPPIHAAILTVNGVPKILHLVVHHIVCDKSSADVIKSEIKAYLVHAAKGEVPRLPAPGWSPRRQYEFEASERAAKLNRRAVQHWRELHETQPCDVHPVRLEDPPSGGCRVKFGSRELGELCEAIVKREGSFDFAVLAVAFAASFANVKGRDVTVFNPLLSNRQFPHTRGYVGTLIETGRVLVDFGRFPKFRDAAKDVMASTMKGMLYGQVGARRIYDPKFGVEPIVDWVGMEGGVQINLVSASSEDIAGLNIQDSMVETVKYSHRTGNSILIVKDQGLIGIALHADGDFLSPEQAEAMLVGLPELLRQFWHDPELTRQDFQGVLPRWTAPPGWIDWRGCWVHELDLTGIIEAFPGVHTAHVPMGGAKGRIDHLVVGVVATEAVTPTALREHMVNTVWPSGACVVPAEFVIRHSAPHDVHSVEAWRDEPGAISRGSGREGDGDTTCSPAETALLRCVQQAHGGTGPRLFENFGEGRGEYLKIPVVLAGLRDAGYRGLSVADLTSQFTLRKLAEKLTSDAVRGGPVESSGSG